MPYSGQSPSSLPCGWYTAAGPFGAIYVAVVSVHSDVASVASGFASSATTITRREIVGTRVTMTEGEDGGVMTTVDQALTARRSG